MDRPSTKLASSHLGMPLAQYVSAYENAIMTPPDWFSDPGYERAQADIRKVSILGRDGLHDLDQISISTFRSIMHYSYSPNGYRDLGSPLLISGCIKIMSKIKESDGGSFLSYELGYACFHIVSVGLAVCLLRGGQDLGFKIKSITVHPELQKLYELSQRTSQIVTDLASHMGGHQRDPHNCILGWSACPEHKKGSLIVSLAEACVLLDLLYTDRHPFLEALGLTYLPGLSAVTFVLWRYVMYQRSLNNLQETQRYLGFLREVFWRCWLVATPHEQASFGHMYRWDKEIWPKRSEAPTSTVEPQHSKAVIRTFIKRLAPVTSMGGEQTLPISLSDLINALNYVGSYFRTGCEDLIAGYIGVTILKMWSILSKQEGSDPLFNRAVGNSMLSAFCNVLQLLRYPHTANAAVALRVIDATIETDLLNLIARTIFMLTPQAGVDRNNQDYSINAHVLKGSEAFYNDISKLVPAQVMRQRFELYGADWWKVTRQLGFLRQEVLPGEHTPSGVRNFFYALCMECWGKVGKSIHHSDTGLPARFCHYMRCPDPWVVAGVMHGCSRCQKAEYCSARCQAMDWMYNHEGRSHRTLCTHYWDE